MAVHCVRRKERIGSVGLEFDGSVFIQNYDSSGYPVRQTAAEFWALSSVLSNILLLLFDPTFAENFLETASNGCSHELRLAAADLYVSLSPRFQEPEELLLLARSAASSAELQLAAATKLISIWADDQSLSAADLQSMALNGENGPLKAAAGYALGLRWLREVEAGRLDLATRFAYPPGGGVTATEGTIAQFAAIHAGVHPELAQAVVLPIFKLLFKP